MKKGKEKKYKIKIVMDGGAITVEQEKTLPEIALLKLEFQQSGIKAEVMKMDVVKTEPYIKSRFKTKK